jgi:hypothetical protein|nr:MAG TPA: hypothetical protein [Caudoviricetes sp.]
MIVQEFYIPKYGDWHVKVYYAVHTYWADRIIMDLYRIGCRGNSLKRAYRNLTEGRMNTGLTYSDYRRRETVMVISLTSTPEEFQNSWDHEKGHLCRHISKAFGIDPYGRKRSILADMWGRRCSLLPRSSYVNIAERDWKNNNRTEAFFDLLELPLN